jgi:hypothetical protein
MPFMRSPPCVAPRNRLLTGTAIAALIAATQSAQADLIQWSVTGDFNDTGTFSGTFTFDTVTGKATIWSLTTHGGTSGVGADTYSSSNEASSSNPFGDTSSSSGSKIDFATVLPAAPYLTYADLAFDDLNPGTPGTVASLTGGEKITNIASGAAGPSRTIMSGTATGTDISVVPEPASGALVLAGIGVLGAYRRNHRRKM